MAEIREVVVPDIGDFADVPVIEVLVSPGDSVAPEDPLVTLESDKATMDVPAPFGGTVAEIRVSVGDTVSEGSPILTLAGRGQRRSRRRLGPGPAPSRRRRRADGASRPSRGRRRSSATAPASPQAAAGHGRGRRAALRQPRGAAPGARAGRRPERRGGLRAQGPDHQGGRAGDRRRCPAARGERRRAGRRAGDGAVAEGGLREVRARRAPGALAHREDQRPEPGPQLGDDPARHPPRRGGRHRARGLPQARQRGARQGGREDDDGRAAAEGLGGGPAPLPAVQRLARRRRPRPQALLPPRLRGRHAAGARGAGDPRRRPQGADRDRRRADRALGPRARGQAQGRGDARGHVHDLLAGRHRRHGVHADHQRAGGGDPRRDALGA